MAGALGMGVVASDPYITEEQAAGSGACLVELDELLRVSDFVSLHLPVGADVPTVIDSRALGLMKPTAYLINTSTPQAVDQTALLEALGGGGIVWGGTGRAREPAYTGGPSRCWRTRT